MRVAVATVILAIAVVATVSWQSGSSSTRAQSEQDPPLAEATGAGSSEELTHPGRIVVRFRSDASGPAIAGLNAAFGAHVLKAQPASGLHRLSLPATANIDQVLQAYRESPLVVEAGFSHVLQSFGEPDDTNYSYQWHLHDTAGGIWAESAWDIAPNNGQGVVVAVIDTGAAYEDFTGPGGLSTQTFRQAPDLAATSFVAPWDFYNNDAHANDDNGHGSHTTGTITQDTNNGYGVAGVAAGSTIMPVKVLAFDGTGFDDDLVESIYYAVDNGADVINMSLGFTGTGAPDANGDVCTEIVGLNAALDYAYDSGVVVVASSGNDGSATTSCPAAYPTVIAVGATRFDGQVAPYSNGGPALDVTAPGGVQGVDQNHDGFSDGVLQETYCADWLTLLFLGTYDSFCDVFYWGTSMAAPHVTGTAALLLGEDPTLTPDEVRFYIEGTARDYGAAGWDPAFGWGVVNAYAAVAALTGAAPTPTLTPPPTATPEPTATPTDLPPAGLPDLTQAALGDPPDSKKADSRFRVTDTARNDGTSQAGGTVTRFYLSSDTAKSADDVLLGGSRAVEALAPGAESSGATRVQIPDGTAPGTYYLLACADDTQLVGESDEANNCRASATTISVTSGGGGGPGNGNGPPGRNR